MRIVTITRDASSDDGTFGLLKTEGFECRTLERPDRGNEPMVSSVPLGIYRVQKIRSPKYGECYGVKDVPGRTHILIHSANWAGDEEKGFKSQLNGCIALGKKVDLIDYGQNDLQRGVTSSRNTVAAFIKHMEFEPFELAILNAEDNSCSV